MARYSGERDGTTEGSNEGRECRVAHLKKFLLDNPFIIRSIDDGISKIFKTLIK
jgi:hypothetical protein